MTATIIQEEIWKPIPDLDERYFISNLGRIKRSAYVGYKFNCTEKIFERKPREDGYVEFSCKIKGVVRHYLIHRLVGQLFIDNPKSLPIINHKDSDRSNNRSSNLEWATYTDNYTHMIKMGRRKNNPSIIKFTPLDGEVFKNIEGSSWYSVSNFGRILSTAHKNPRILKVQQNTIYPVLSLRLDNGDKKSFTIHRLVADQFVDNPNGLPIVNHKDGDKKNIHFSNLEWTCYSENSKHSFRINNKRSGENHHKTFLSNDTVLAIAEDIKNNVEPSLTKERFSISNAMYWRVKSGISYSLITGIPRAGKTKRPPLTIEDIKRVKELLSLNTIKDVVCITGLSLSTVSNISTGFHKLIKAGVC